MRNYKYIRLAQYKQGIAPIIIALIVAVILGGGYLIWSKKSTLKDQGVSTSITKDETVNWKTYKNDNPGFSFSYPASWGQSQKVSNYSGTVDSISFKNGFVVTVGVYLNPITKRNFTISEIADGYKKSENLKNVKTENIKIDGHLATKITYNDGQKNWTYVLIYQDQQSQEKLIEFVNNDFYSVNIETFDQILSTFKFTAPKVSVPINAQGTDIVCAPYINNTINHSPGITTKKGVSTYLNSDYGFQMTYPDNLHASSNFVGAYSLDGDWRQNSHCSFNDYSRDDVTHGLPYILFGQQIASVMINKATYTSPKDPGNTYSYGAELRIGASGNIDEVKHCLDTDSEVVSTSDVNINGITFHKYNYERTALVNRTNFSSYRTIHNNTCFAIEPAFSWVADKPNTLISKDQLVVDSIINSFKFTK